MNSGIKSCAVKGRDMRLECVKVMAWSQVALRVKREEWEADGYKATHEPRKVPKSFDGKEGGVWYQQMCRKREYIYDRYPIR